MNDVKLTAGLILVVGAMYIVSLQIFPTKTEAQVIAENEAKQKVESIEQQLLDIKQDLKDIKCELKELSKRI